MNYFIYFTSTSRPFSTIQNSFNFEKAKNLFTRDIMVLSRAAQMLRPFLKVLQCKNYNDLFFLIQLY